MNSQHLLERLFKSLRIGIGCCNLIIVFWRIIRKKSKRIKSIDFTEFNRFIEIERIKFTRNNNQFYYLEWAQSIPIQRHFLQLTSPQPRRVI